MIRGILAVIVGFVVMAVWVFGTFAAAIYTLGESYAFDESTNQVTLVWCLLDLGLALIGAVLGGFTAAAIGAGPTKTPVKVLAGVVLLLGLGQAAGMMYGPEADPESSTEVLFNEPVAEEPEGLLAKVIAEMEAAMEYQPPTWYPFALPVVGLVGVLLGGKLKRKGAAF